MNTKRSANSKSHLADCRITKFTLIMYNTITTTITEYRHEKDDKFIKACACVTWSFVYDNVRYSVEV